MADIAAKLVELSADKLCLLHERLHKSEATPASIEVHHLATTEMLRRGMERPADDTWDEFEIQVDYVEDVDLNSFSSSLPLDLIQEVVKETGSSIGNVLLVLTSIGYQMRIDPVDTFEKHNQGKHDQKTHGSWADGIAEEILAGGHPEVEPENLSAFLMKASKRTDHPDLTELSVKGTLLYGDEGMGIARKDMPQIPGKERARFLNDIEKSNGITVEKEKIDPKTLKPIQKEISASRSGAIYNKFRKDGEIPKDERILISKDGYVVDGHHTWGAAVAFSFDNPGTELPVYRLSVTAKEAMAVSLEWSKANGFEAQAIDAPAKKSLTWMPLKKHGTHDQSTHGSWANGMLAADKAPLKSRSADAVRLAKSLRATCVAVEPAITGLMQNIGAQIGGEFQQLHQRLKSTDSLARKIDTDAEKEWFGDRDKAAEKVSDAIRYTMVIPDSGYTDGVIATRDALEANGFKLRTKNFWEAGDPYDGVNVKASRDGISVEIQLHTPPSLNTKTKELHSVYEKYRKETNNPKREVQWDSMVKIAKKIPRPAKLNELLAIPDLTMQLFETAEQAGLIKSTLVDILKTRGGQA